MNKDPRNKAKQAEETWQDADADAVLTLDFVGDVGTLSTMTEGDLGSISPRHQPASWLPYNLIADHDQII